MVPEPLDIDERMNVLGGLLPSVRRQNSVDILLLVVVVLLGTAAIAGTIFTLASSVVEIAVLGLVAVSFAGVYTRMMSRPDHVRALQSDRILNAASESLAYLRQGLEEQTAGEVCRIVLRQTEAAAVAITNREQVLGFAGVGEEHHLVGGPIITKATHDALDLDSPQILHSKEEIGCPEPSCRLRSAIVVPLEMREQAVGTLKFYYKSDRYLNETQLAMAEGLARLLSTQLELSELEAQTDLAREMELKALQAQINPHFLFNTINTIAAFIRTDPSEAHRLLRQFGTFYRRTLEQADDLVTLDRELEFVRTYVELEQARFGNRLVVQEAIEDATRSLAMPAFMIQPLVENCVGHGMPADGRPLTVVVSATRGDDEIIISVSDDGAGISPERLGAIFEPGSGKGLGIALRNVRDRLAGYYGPESVLTIESEPDHGTTVHLVIRLLPA
ncbi:MAG: sensor histidine kinase [Actinobacteria bacterium HGW-Actinobacteria-7]|jgi:two-component system sensor histidine kinase LytS|nr:MAG: sensor histidine kinase [Actinobacteria bacterium HGW-Actinobacteria-7]